MADIAPLRGIVYNKDKIGDVSILVAPPCGVVTPEEQARFHQCHRYNAMNLDFGAQHPDDGHPFEWHRRAGREFNQWLTEGVLVRHEKPAVYLVETGFIYPTTGERRTRLGFICLLKLEEFGPASMVKPHERTFTTFREERLSHMRHIQANLSQVFGIFPDDEKRAAQILGSTRKEPPLFDFKDQSDCAQRMWPVWDREVIRALTGLLKPKTVYIADGHHRYESALEYRRYQESRDTPIGPKSSINYLMVYLCADSDPGLSILPAHRMLTRTIRQSVEELETALDRFFEIESYDYHPTGKDVARRHFLHRLKECGARRTTLGLYTRLAHRYYLLKKRSQHPDSPALSSWPRPLRQLDTVTLTSFIFQEVLGMTEEDLDDATQISYSTDAHMAIDSVNEGRAELAVLHNPTIMDQVRTVADSGLTMPRKSTHFFPKVVTGLVFNAVKADEEIETIL